MKSDFFIDRPVFSTVLSIIIVIVGAIGATRTLHDGMKVSMDCRQGSVQSLAE